MGRMVYAELLLEFSLTSFHPRFVANSHDDRCAEDSLPGQNSTRASVVLTTQAEPRREYRKMKIGEITRHATVSPLAPAHG